MIDRLHSRLNDVLTPCIHAISKHHGFELWKHNTHCFLSSILDLISIQQASKLEISLESRPVELLPLLQCTQVLIKNSRCREEGEQEVRLERRRCYLRCCSWQRRCMLTPRPHRRAASSEPMAALCRRHQISCRCPSARQRQCHIAAPRATQTNLALPHLTRHSKLGSCT